MVPLSYRRPIRKGVDRDQQFTRNAELKRTIYDKLTKKKDSSNLEGNSTVFQLHLVKDRRVLVVYLQGLLDSMRCK